MPYKHFPPTQKDHARRRAFFGIFVAVIGVLLLLQMLHVLPPVIWTLRLGWPLVLIILGLAIGFKTGFRNHAWWILILLGIIHFIPPFEVNGVPSRRIIWPSILIVAGLLIYLRRNRHRSFESPHFISQTPGADRGAPETFTNSEDAVNIEVLFGGRKELVTSQNFTGGRIAASFSGVELNLARADATAPMVLDIRTNFASVELIVPAHWEIKNEIAPTMGSVEDERRVITPADNTEKPLLILRGSCTFGSVEIKSY